MAVWKEVYKLIKVPGYNALFPEVDHLGFLLCKMQQKQ